MDRMIGFTPIRSIYQACNITWPPPQQLNSFQQRYVDTIEFPFNTLVPKQEASITYNTNNNRSRPLQHNQQILAEKTLLRPTATWPTAGYTGLYTVVLADVSIRSNSSAIQWIVTNIQDNDIAGGEEVMEYVSPIAWRWVRRVQGVMLLISFKLGTALAVQTITMNLAIREKVLSLTQPTYTGMFSMYSGAACGP